LPPPALIVHLRGHFLFVDESLVAAKVVLGLHVIGFGRFQLGVGGGELLSAEMIPAPASCTPDAVNRNCWKCSRKQSEQ